MPVFAEVSFMSLTNGPSVMHVIQVVRVKPKRICGCSSVVEHLLAKERVESSNLFIRFLVFPAIGCHYIIYYDIHFFEISVSFELLRHLIATY